MILVWRFLVFKEFGGWENRPAQLRKKTIRVGIPCFREESNQTARCYRGVKVKWLLTNCAAGL